MSCMNFRTSSYVFESGIGCGPRLIPQRGPVCISAGRNQEACALPLVLRTRSDAIANRRSKVIHYPQAREWTDSARRASRDLARAWNGGRLGRSGLGARLLLLFAAVG